MAEYTKSEAQDWSRENLRGQWTTLMTPFTEDDEVDEAGLRRNIRHVRQLGTRGGGCTWAVARGTCTRCGGGADSGMGLSC